MQIRKLLLTTAISLATCIIPTVAYGQAYGQVTTETLNLRSEPTTESQKIGQLDKSDKMEVVSRVDDEWLEIMTGNGKSAYVYAAYIDILDVEGTIAGDGVRLRDYPDAEDSEIFDTLYTGDTVVVEYTVGTWCKVMANGLPGFVNKQFIVSDFLDEVETKVIEDVKRVEKPVVQTQTVSSRSTQSNPVVESAPAPIAYSEDSSVGDALIQDAKQFLGNRYVYGGTSLTNGIDCSAFTQQIMARQGVSITRTSSSQYANDGYKVSSDNLQKGDLLFYGYNGAVSHVGIYIGDGQIIHANTSSTGIVISGAFSVGKPFIGAKRVL